MLEVVRCKGCANATFQRPQMESRGLKVLETVFILKKSQFMMIHCIYGSAFFCFFVCNISSYIYKKLSGKRDAQTNHFTDHHNHFIVQNVKNDQKWSQRAIYDRFDHKKIYGQAIYGHR